MSPKTFKPFDGRVDYDWIIWLDSDQVWDPEDIAQLLTNADHKVVTGMVLMNDNKRYNVSVYEETVRDKCRWLTREDIDFDGERIVVHECGMGFMAVQRGVFEQLEYPWFFPTAHDDGDMLWFEAEDGSFVNRVKKLGITVWADPTVQVGHEKVRVLRGDSPHGDMV